MVARIGSFAIAIAPVCARRRRARSVVLPPNPKLREFVGAVGGFNAKSSCP
jgi:hypothetical protein